jgi:branched-chain amino acid aminotransferase
LGLPPVVSISITAYTGLKISANIIRIKKVKEDKMLFLHYKNMSFMGECRGRYFIENGEIRETSLFDNLCIYEGVQVYEVIRVMDGVPLFFEDHALRLEESGRLSGYTSLARSEDILADILLLSQKNGVINGNVKVVFRYNGEGNHYLLYFIEAIYPDNSLYTEGVKTILYRAERRNPAVKLFNYRLRASVLDTLLAKGAYEAFLVNRNGCITEGSRSNVFFVADNQLVTAGDKHVLGGITRKKVIDICESEGIGIRYRCMESNRLLSVDAVFLTGTSPQVLPVRSIDEIDFPVNNAITTSIIRQYSSMVTEYIESRR